MKKINRIIYGTIAFAFTFGFFTNVVKTDFQKHLEKSIKVSLEPDSVDSSCYGTCSESPKI